MPYTEREKLLQKLAASDIEAFDRLQPRLYRAFPGGRNQQQAEEGPTIVVSVESLCNVVPILKAASKAAGRGLALVSQGASHSSSSGLSAHRQGLWCITRCCHAVARLAGFHVVNTPLSHARRAQVEVAVAVQSSGEQLCCVTQHQQHGIVIGI